ncbi:MAG: hypothetical protein J3Q66DRAFT_397809 [Benniella sp.]|nr:MAG: hypothetical protein J3Q66DRAFT_397809 [Benniella sp.]
MIAAFYGYRTSPGMGYWQETQKEHVSLPDFVKKFDITDRDKANEAFLTLISCTHLRESRRNQLQAAFKLSRERNENTFRERRALRVTDKSLMTSSADVAKEAAVIAQNSKIIDCSDTESESSPLQEDDADALYDLIACFLKVKDKSATLPSPASSALNERSIHHRNIYKAARDYLQQPGPVEAKKDAFSEIHKTITDLLDELLKALYPDLDKDRYCDPDFVPLQRKVWKVP